MRCRFCGDHVRRADGVWVDGTDGDVCSGDDSLTNEGGNHVVTETRLMVLIPVLFVIGCILEWAIG